MVGDMRDALKIKASLNGNTLRLSAKSQCVVDVVRNQMLAEIAILANRQKLVVESIHKCD